MAFDVKVWPARGEPSIEFDDVDYVSLTNSGTYGKPPLIAPAGPIGERATAVEGDNVLYLNPEHYVAIEIEVK